MSDTLNTDRRRLRAVGWDTSVGAVAGPVGEPVWARVALAGILVLAAGLLLWQLPENGWANAYYSDAVRTASRSWSAFWTASLDASHSVSIDKTPLSIWMMALSARLFGFGPAALLVPNALCALGSVALIYDLARRAFGTPVGLLAALFLAVTPVSVAVGRFNNPDALLVFLLLAAAWAAARGVQSGRARYPIVCGVLVGLAFNTKMLQAYLVVPAFAAALLFAAPGEMRRRLRLLAIAAIAMTIVSGAWIGAMSLAPNTARPWVGDTTTNSWWQLVFSANGVGRINAGVLPGDPSSSGAGLLRLLHNPTGGQIAWLAPLAIAGAAIAARMLWRGQGTRAIRANLLMWTVWAAVHLVVFSVLLGLFHAYYTSALAPAVAVLAALGSYQLWVNRTRSARWMVAGLLAMSATVALALALLAHAPHFLPWLGSVVVAVAIVAAVLAPYRRPSHSGRIRAAFAAAGLLVAVLAGPLSYCWATTERQLGGIDPLAGPGRYEEPLWTSDDDLSRARLIDYLLDHQGRDHYLAAVSGSLAGAPIALLTGRPTLIMGGFAGSDPAPTVARLARLVATGQLDFVILTSMPAAADGATARGLGGARARSAWVRAHCSPAPIATTLPAPTGTLRARLYHCGKPQATSALRGPSG